MRQERTLAGEPFAVVCDVGNMQVLTSLSAEAEGAGLSVGQTLRDAMAMCPELNTRMADRQAEEVFLTALCRWAGKFSPWVAEEQPTGLLLDLSGSTHLFGGEAALLATIETECSGMGLTVRAGLADTVGAAWALARYAGQGAQAVRTGDAVDQEARATRARAAKRRNWERGGASPRLLPQGNQAARIASHGQTRQAISGLPVAALRLSEDAVVNLSRLGLRRVGDLFGAPRASLARRFGREVVQRLDQALGVVPEPISPAPPPPHFAARLTLPEPIGLESDILAALDRLLPVLTQRLREKGRGARRVCLQAFRCDQTMQRLEVGLARPTAEPERIRPLLAMKLAELDVGFGIDMLRLEALMTESLPIHQHSGHLEAAQEVSARLENTPEIDDLIGRIGARIGLETITRLHPAESHIPEKSAKILAAAWSEPVAQWPSPTAARPLLIWRPEPVMAPDADTLPLVFRWRQRTLTVASAIGPERIAPEWWLDEPDWRTGVRDYWQVTVTTGERLWLYLAHGGTMSAGWFCHGSFA